MALLGKKHGKKHNSFSKIAPHCGRSFSSKAPKRKSKHLF